MTPLRKGGALGVLRDASVLLVGSAAIALAANAVRRDGLPLVQHNEYDILVPCTETSGQISEIEPRDPLLSDKTSLIIDARSKALFDTWHPSSAINIPFDYLTATSDADVKKVTASRAARVIVFGDGDDPDCGRELGRELAGKGVRNVFVVKGGAPALGAPSAPKQGGEVPLAPSAPTGAP